MRRSATEQPTDRRPAARRVGVGVGLTLAAMVVVAACSRDQGARPPMVTTQQDPADTTTTTAPAPGRSTAPSTTVDPAQPVELAWVRQVGGLGGDELASVAGRDASVVAVGSTGGAVGPTQGGRDTLTVVVASDGTAGRPRQAGSDGTDRAAGVSASGTSTLACGTSDSTRGPRATGTPDGWCAPVAEDGTLGEEVAIGGDADDTLVAVALTRPSADGGPGQPTAVPDSRRPARATPSAPRPASCPVPRTPPAAVSATA